jgi:hypothetical protein
MRVRHSSNLVNEPGEFGMVDTAVSVAGGFGFLTDLIGIQMRNIEAIQEAQQKTLEGIGVLAKRQTEIIEGTLRRSVSEPAPVTSPDIRGAVSHQIEPSD